MQVFSADTAIFSNKIIKILGLKTWKTLPQKLLTIGPEAFFLYWPGCPIGPKQKSHTTKSPLMQDPVFRLGPFPNFVATVEKKPSSLINLMLILPSILRHSDDPAHLLELIVESIILVIPSSIYWHQSVAHSTPGHKVNILGPNQSTVLGCVIGLIMGSLYDS